MLDGCVDFRGWWTLVHQDQWISFGFSKEWISWLSQDLVCFFGGLDQLAFSVVWIAWLSQDLVGFFGGLDQLVFSVVWIGWLSQDLVGFF